jgi:hypothetical protein
MKPLHIPLLILAACLSACLPSHRAEPALIIPSSAPQTVAAGQIGAAADAGSEQGEVHPRITLDRGDKLLSVIDVNLDQDADPEQVIAVKKRDEVDSLVRVILADCDSAKGRYYYQSWESPTASTSSRVFSMYVKDLVGDHGLEIVVGGMNTHGKLTLNVFKRASPTTGLGLVMREVCSIAADDIVIEQSDRPESYTLGQKNADSFPIDAYSQDPDSMNVMDLIRIPYSWSYAENRYVAGTPQKVPREKVEQDQLARLFTGTNVESFEQFLQGPWVELSEPTAPSQKVRALEIVSFEPDRRRITRYLGDTEEMYVWGGSIRTVYDRLLVFTENEAVHTVSRTFSIRVVSTSSLEIAIQGGDLGDSSSAVYQKLTDDVARRYLTRDSLPVTLAPPDLEGTYQSTDGLVITFLGQRLIWAAGAQARSGAFVVFSIGGHRILSIRLFDARGLPAESKSFLVQPGRKRVFDRAIETLTLSPVLLTVDGFEEAAGDPITVERIQESNK